MKKTEMNSFAEKVLMCAALAFCTFLLASCAFLSEETVKLRDLEFTVLSEEMVPQELLAILEEKKSEPFQFTYSDNEFLYICVGYGEQ